MLASLMQALPIATPANGRKERYLMAALDRLGAPKTGIVKARLGDATLAFDLSIPSQRTFYYLRSQVMREAKRSGLYVLMKDIRGGTFLDIGAYLGVYSLLARECGFDAIAFEPDPDQYGFLDRNRHVFTAHNIALSDHEGTATFYRSTANPGSNSLTPAAGRYASETTVRAARLDALPLDGVTLVKIDVEGHEAAVIRGMAGFLKAHRPVIWCEVRGAENDRSANSDREVIRLLVAHGYRPHVFDRGKFRPFMEADRRGLYDLMFRT